MVRDRENEQWVEDLGAKGPLQDSALSDPREILLVGLKVALKSRPDFVDSLLDDFVQDSLLRVLRSLDQFQNRSRLVTRAAARAVRVALPDLRRRRWRDVSLESLMADTGFAPVSSSDGTDDSLVEAMYRIIRSDLTEKQRTALLTEIKGMAQVEIARQMQSSPNATFLVMHALLAFADAVKLWVQAEVSVLEVDAVVERGPFRCAACWPTFSD